MPGLMLSRTPRTVLGVLVARVRSASGTDGSCPWSGNGRAGSLTPKDTPVGLDGPMPHTITPVVWGRCRPSPDRVPLGAPADRHGGSVVASGLPVVVGEGLLPVLGAPAAGVGRVHGNDRDAGLVGHRGQPGAELAGGHAGDELPEPFAPAVFLAGLLCREVQVFNRDGLHAAGPGPVQQPGEGVANLGITVIGGAREVIEEPAGAAGRVAVDIEAPGGEVVGVHVDADHTVREGGGDRYGLGDRDLPGGGHLPAVPVRVVVDAVSDPAHRDDDMGVRPRLRAAHVCAPCPRPSAHRTFRSREASEPRCAPTSARTLSSAGVSCLSRVRTATPEGPGTTNDAAASHPTSPTWKGHAFDRRTPIPLLGRQHPATHQDPPPSLTLARTHSYPVTPQQFPTPRPAAPGRPRTVGVCTGFC